MTTRYDLEERTTKFSEGVIDLLIKISRNDITSPMISQLIRSATSVGANYHEANGASSKKDFRNKISISKKEIQETRYWLRLLLKAQPNQKSAIDSIADEARQLNLIFNRIIATLDKNLSLKIEN